MRLEECVELVVGEAETGAELVRRRVEATVPDGSSDEKAQRRPSARTVGLPHRPQIEHASSGLRRDAVLDRVCSGEAQRMALAEELDVRLIAKQKLKRGRAPLPQLHAGRASTGAAFQLVGHLLPGAPRRPVRCELAVVEPGIPKASGVGQDPSIEDEGRHREQRGGGTRGDGAPTGGGPLPQPNEPEGREDQQWRNRAHDVAREGNVRQHEQCHEREESPSQYESGYARALLQRDAGPEHGEEEQRRREIPIERIDEERPVLRHATPRMRQRVA